MVSVNIMAKKINVYKDKHASSDFDVVPGNRPSEVCLNCGRLHGLHFGWACKEHYNVMNFGEFSKLHHTQRYLTKSMYESMLTSLASSISTFNPKDYINPNLVPKAKQSIDDNMNDWRTWAKVRTGNCACDIPKHQCKYHS